MITLTAAVFFVLSFVFSMLGMGGGQIYIPVLYWLGFDFKLEAIPLGLLLNFCVQISSSVTYVRKKMVDFRTAVPFAAVMFVFTPLGALFSFYIPTKPVIFLFALFTFFASLFALSGYKPTKKIEGKKKLFLVISVAAVLGFLVGLIGRGGGSFIVPTLLLIGIPAKTCAATSSFIVFFSSGIGFISHIFKSKLDLYLTSSSVIAVIAGSQAGSRFMAARINHRVLKKIFGVVLMIVALSLFAGIFK